MTILKPTDHDVLLEDITASRKRLAWRALDNGLVSALDGHYPYRCDHVGYPEHWVDQRRRTSVPRETWDETLRRVEDLVRDANRSCFLLTDIACRNPHTPLVIQAYREMWRRYNLVIVGLMEAHDNCWTVLCGPLRTLLSILTAVLYGFVSYGFVMFTFLLFLFSPLTLLGDRRYRKFFCDRRNDEYRWLVDQIRDHPELQTDAINATIYNGLITIANDLAELEISVPVTHVVRNFPVDLKGSILVHCDVWSLWFPLTGGGPTGVPVAHRVTRPTAIPVVRSTVVAP